MITMIGGCNIDYITYGKRLPRSGETIYGDKMLITGGGKGANQIAAAARLGAETCLLSKIGDDANAQIVIKDLKWARVNVSNVEIVGNTYTGAGFLSVANNGQNFITIIKGANAYITPDYIDKNIDNIINAKICMTEFMIPLESAGYATKIAKQHGIKTIVNPAPAFPIKDRFYKVIDIITPNEVEATDLTGIKINDKMSASKASDFFHEKGVKNVIVTMGSKGAFVSDGSRSELISNYNIKVIDTSGAGDAFNGGLAYAIWKGRDIFESAQFAMAVANISVSRNGTMPSMPTLEEVNELLKEMK